MYNISRTQFRPEEGGTLPESEHHQSVADGNSGSLEKVHSTGGPRIIDLSKDPVTQEQLYLAKLFMISVAYPSAYRSSLGGVQGSREPQRGSKWYDYTSSLSDYKRLMSVSQAFEFISTNAVNHTAMRRQNEAAHNPVPGKHPLHLPSPISVALTPSLSLWIAQFLSNYYNAADTIRGSST